MRVPRTAPPQVGSLRDFALAVGRVANGTAVVVLAGELDLYRAPEIEHALEQVVEPRLAVDLSSVTFLDSSTLEVLHVASRRQRARGGELLILVGPQTPTTAFEVTGFDRLLAIRRVDGDPRATAA
jgi:anti-anti-sigma factor